MFCSLILVVRRSKNRNTRMKRSNVWERNSNGNQMSESVGLYYCVIWPLHRLCCARNATGDCVLARCGYVLESLSA
jgi:hypothetical protein